MLYFKENRQQLRDFLAVARKKATRASGEIDESQLRCAFNDHSSHSPKPSGRSSAINLINSLDPFLKFNQCHTIEPIDTAAGIPLEAHVSPSEQAGLQIVAAYAKNYPMNLDERITIEPGKRSGKPCIRGMRIAVYDVFEWLASGMTPEAILEDYPELTIEDIHACYKYAANREMRWPRTLDRLQ